MKTRQVKLLSVVGCVSMLASAAFADVVPTSMVAGDGRRVVARTEGTNVVYDLVTDADLPPARPWRIYVVKATHTDIGLHNSQYIQRHGTVKRIEDAMRLVDADTRADDDPAAYRYVMEGVWFWENYPMDRGEAAAWNVISNYVRRGRMDIACGCAGIFGLTMTNVSVYSLLYNGSYMLPNTVVAIVCCLLLRKPLQKYLSN